MKSFAENKHFTFITGQFMFHKNLHVYISKNLYLSFNLTTNSEI